MLSHFANHICRIVFDPNKCYNQSTIRVPIGKRKMDSRSCFESSQVMTELKG